MRILIFLITAFTCIGCTTRSEQKFNLPAEWEEHEAIWIGWDTSSEENNMVMANIIKHLEGNVKIKVVYPNDIIRIESFQMLHHLAIDTSEIEAHVFPGASAWIRDFGPVFGIDSTGQLAMLDFGWNQYGQVDWSYQRWPEWFEGRYDSIKASVELSDISRIDSLIGVTTHARYNKIDIILEGGSFEYNGNGVLIQCESVTLQRNPGKTKEELELEFKRFGIEKVIWLPEGVVEDEHFIKLIDHQYLVGGTGGHTDEFVRFVDSKTILLAWVDENEIHEHPINQLNFDRMSKNLAILEKATDIHDDPFTIIKVPLPRPIETPITIVDEWDPDPKKNNTFDIGELPEGHSLSVGDTISGIAAAGYLNFLVTNGMVITAGYSEYGSQDKDMEVKTILQQVFPDRSIIMIHARPLNGSFGGGGIHCVTLHEPKVH